MKFIKSTEKEGCKSLMKVQKKEEKTKDENKVIKILSFLGENKRRAIVVGCSVILIAAAIFLNWQLFGVAAQESPNQGASGNVTTEPPATGVSGNVSDKETYFALAMIERQRARDEAIRVLQNVVDSTDASDSDKSTAINSISSIAKDMNNETSIQTLLRAQGYEDCIAVIENGKASIIIGTNESLNPAQIAQITEIVYRGAGIPPEGVYISERKG